MKNLQERSCVFDLLSSEKGFLTYCGKASSCLMSKHENAACKDQMSSSSFWGCKAKPLMPTFSHVDCEMMQAKLIM